jgi:hypothetical protein
MGSVRCAGAANGHAAAPPSAAMNARRFMAIPPERTREDSTFAYSITLVAAGAAGFLTLIQSGERPD